MTAVRHILTLDSNIFIAALKTDEPYAAKCAALVDKATKSFALSEPSLIYQEVCGTLARRLGEATADKARRHLDLAISPLLLVNCDKAFCVSAYPLCSEYGIYAIDALYLNTAIRRKAILVSLDEEDFVKKLKFNHQGIEVYHVSEFPY